MEEIITTDSFQDAIRYNPDDYLLHLFCLNGTAGFVLNGKPYTIKQNDCVIPSNRMPISQIVTSEDFRCCVIIIAWPLLLDSTPVVPYNVVGHLGMTQNPILPMLNEEMTQCLHNIDSIIYRYSMSYHTFHKEVLKRSIELFILDLYDIHARLGKKELTLSSNAERHVRKFISMLQEGMCKEVRSASVYADKLCITPKYLTEICQQVTHHTPSYWIDYFTGTMIKQRLMDNRATLLSISEEFNFSSLSYFSRYCTRVLGRKPSQLR